MLGVKVQRGNSALGSKPSIYFYLHFIRVRTRGVGVPCVGSDWCEGVELVRGERPQ